MKIAMIGCCAALALALPARAQTVEPDPVATTQVVEPTPADVVVVEPAPETAPPDVVVVSPAEPPANAGAYDALPPGGQKIARALFAAQVPTAPATADGGGGAAGWSLDEVAAARAQGGWGIVLKQMQSEGLVSAKNLGEVVSGRAAVAAPVSRTPVVVSYGNSDATTIATAGKGHRHAAAPAIVTAAGGGGSVAIKPHGGHAATTAATITKASGGNAHGGGKGKTDKHGK